MHTDADGLAADAGRLRILHDDVGVFCISPQKPPFQIFGANHVAIVVRSATKFCDKRIGSNACLGWLSHNLQLSRQELFLEAMNVSVLRASSRQFAGVAC